SIQTAAAKVRQKKVMETREIRRASTLAPKPSIRTAVKRVGTADAEKAYAAKSVKAMVTVLCRKDPPHCEGRDAKKSMLRTYFGRRARSASAAIAPNAAHCPPSTI